MRFRRIMLTLIAAALLATLGISHTLAGSIPTHEGQQPILVAATPLPPKLWKLSTQTSQEAGQKPDFAINISRPVLETADNQVGAFTKAVDSFIKQTVDEFKKGLGVEIKDAPKVPSTLDIGYDAYTTSRGLISIRFRIDSYMVGAAHPSHNTYSLSYDVNTNKIIALADLFKPGSKYLDTIAAFCVKELKAQDRLNFPEGAAAKPENYARWNFDRGGILITFDSGQVGPYAVGAVEVLIPYIALESVIKPDVPFWQY